MLYSTLLNNGWKNSHKYLIGKNLLKELIMTVKLYSLRNGSKKVANTMLLFNEEDPMVTLTIVPSVSNAVVTFSTGTVAGNACTVKPGTSVSYTITCEGYKSISNTVVVNDNQSINVTLEKEVVKHTLKHCGFGNIMSYTVSVNGVSVFNHNNYAGDVIPETETLLGSYDEGSTVKMHVGAEDVMGKGYEPYISIYVDEEVTDTDNEDGGIHIAPVGHNYVADNNTKSYSLDYEFTLTKDSIIGWEAMG